MGHCVGVHGKFLGAPPEQASCHRRRLDLVRLLLDIVTRVRAAARANPAAPRAPDLSHHAAPRRPLLGHLFLRSPLLNGLAVPGLATVASDDASDEVVVEF